MHLPSRTLWKYTLGELRRRPGRSLLALLGVVGGVAGIVAVLSAQHTGRDALQNAFTPVGGRAPLEIVAEGGGPFPAPVEGQFAAQGVAHALPVVQTPAALLTPGGNVPVLVLGIDPGRDALARPFAARPADPGDPDDAPGRHPGVWLGEAFARRHGLHPGGAVRLSTPRGPVELPVRGTLGDRGPGRFLGGALAVMPLDQARQLYTGPEEVTAVSLIPHDGRDAERVRREVQAVLEPGLVVRRPAERGDLPREVLRPMEQSLSAFSVVALVASAFVILNTFRMNLGERQRRLALLRALGATRRQIAGLLLREALLFGVTGTLLGVLAGLGLAAVLLRVYEDMLRVPLPWAAVRPGALGVALLLGPGLTVLAALPAAWRAAERHPLPALRARPPTPAERARRWPGWAGLALVAAAVLFNTLLWADAIRPDVGEPLLPLFLALALAGCVLAVPLVLPAAAALAAGLLVPLAGVEAKLALRQLERQPARTGLTVGVLAVGLVVSVGFGNAFLINLADILAWYERSIDVDYLVRAAPVDPGILLPGELPEGLEAEVAAAEGVTAVQRVRLFPSQAEGRPAFVIARDFAGPGGALPVWALDGGGDLDDRLRAGEAALAAPLARALHKKPGDTLTLATRRGPRDVRVAAVVKEYGMGGMMLYLDYDAARGLYGFERPHALGVATDAGKREAAEAALRGVAARRGVTLQPNREFRGLIEGAAVGVQVVLAGLMALVFGVAALGVVNTLSTNVVEQSRELGVLRALGMKRRQVRRLVVAQAVALCVMSAVPGAGVGVLMAWLMNVSTPALLGHPVPFRVEWWYVGVCLLASLLLALAAALVPAGRAARLPVARALQME